MYQDIIEILGLDLFQTLKNQMEIVERVQRYFNMGIGWHYYLDLAWMLKQIENIPKGSLLLDAGAGTGLMQFIVAELGFNVISVDFATHQFSKQILNRYHGIIHYINDPSLVFDNVYARHIEKVYNLKSSGPKEQAIYPQTAQMASKMIERLKYKPDVSEPMMPTDILKDDVSNYCGRIFIYRSDLKQLSLLQDNFVDGIISVSALEHNEHNDFEKCINELYRVTKHGGFIAATVSASLENDWYHQPSKGWCYSEGSLKKLFILPETVESNFQSKDTLFTELKKENNELHKRLAPLYFKSGDNGMPWGKWVPKYQPVGVLKIKDDDGSIGDSPLVSIVVPCYNASATLESTLNSILLQEYPNYEVIMIDDGSSDNTPEIIKKYETHDFRFRSFRQSNQGVSAARNKGAELARGELVMFLDADDILYKRSLSDRVKVFVEEDTPSLLGAFCLADMIFADGKSMGIPPLFNYSLPNDRLYFSYTPESVFNPSCVILKKKEFMKTGGFDVTITPAEDFDLWHRMMRRGGYFKIVRSCKIGYTQHPNSAVRCRLVKHYQQCKRVSQRIFSEASESIPECKGGFDNSLYQRSISNRAFRTAIMAISLGQYDVINEFIVDINKYGLEITDSSTLEAHVKFAALRSLCRHERDWCSVVWPQVREDVLKFISELNNKLGGDCHSLLQLKRRLEIIGQVKDSPKQTASIFSRIKQWINTNVNTRKFYFILFGYSILLILFTAVIVFLLLND